MAGSDAQQPLDSESAVVASIGGGGLGSVNIGGNEIPIVGFGNAVWGLLNLVITILCILGSVILLINFLLRYQKDKNQVQFSGQTQPQPHKKQKNQFSAITFRILAAVAGFITPVAFLLTQDVRRKMVFVDEWTFMMLLFGVLQLVLVVFMHRAQRMIEQEEEEIEDEPLPQG